VHVHLLHLTPPPVRLPRRFTGSTAIDPHATAAFRVPSSRAAAVSYSAPGAAPPGEAPDQLEKQLAASLEVDRELAQCLQHLGKRDATTRLKALQVCGLQGAARHAPLNSALLGACTVCGLQGAAWQGALRVCSKGAAGSKGCQEKVVVWLWGQLQAK